ncbi:hypothetical protein AB1Y20_009931 [Prymnesium parvum]|uniref:Amino acid transporter n=1 Tax=Prymnesium parvum TaxID=97485 RepID=A0AB34K2Z9_PRYPA
MSMSVARLLNVDTAAYYALAIGWILTLILISEAVLFFGGKVRAFAPILLFVVLFCVLEALKRLSKGGLSTFVRLTGPGNTVLGNWISLMFFVYMIALPASLAGVSAYSILGWVGALLVATTLNLIASAALAAAASRVRCRRRTRPLDDEGAIAIELVDARRAESARASASPDCRTSERRSLRSLAGARDSHVGALLHDFGDAIRHVEMPAETGRFLAALDFAVHASLSRNDVLVPPDAAVLLDLLRAEHPASRLAEALRAKLGAEYREHAAVQAELVALAAASAAALACPLPTWGEVTRAFALLAAGGAVGALLYAPAPCEWGVWLFQLGGVVAAHTVATAHHRRLVWWMPRGVQLLVQPAALSCALLIAVAGLSWPGGFVDGLRTYIHRHGPHATLFDTPLDAWGPGKLITINLNPAIIVLAFPTSTHLSGVRRLHLLAPLVFLTAVMSLVSSALIGRLLIELPVGSRYGEGPSALTLSMLPHSVSTAVAVGYADVLCRGAVCAQAPVIATSCVLTGTLVMVIGRPLLTAVGITSPFARGISCGSTGMALGVTALKAGGEEEAVGVAAVSYALYAVAAAVILTIHLDVRSLDFFS